MVRRLLWVGIISSSLAMFGQMQQQVQPGAPYPIPPTPGAMGAPITQVYQQPVYVPVMPQVVGGYYLGYTGGGIYGLTTPTASFASPQPTAGISLADRAGISTSTPIGTWVPSTLPPTTLVYTNVQPAVTEMALPEEEAVVPQGAVPAPRPKLGPSRWGGAGFVGAVPPQPAARSLGEVATQYRRPGAPPSIRRYTNADVERILSTMPLRGFNVNERLLGPPPQPAPPPAAAPKPPAAPQKPPAVPPKVKPSPAQQEKPKSGGEAASEE